MLLCAVQPCFQSLQRKGWKAWLLIGPRLLPRRRVPGVASSRLKEEWRSCMQPLPCVHHDELEVGTLHLQFSLAPATWSVRDTNPIVPAAAAWPYDNGSREHHLTSETQCRLGQIATRGHIPRTASRRVETAIAHTHWSTSDLLVLEHISIREIFWST